MKRFFLKSGLVLTAIIASAAMVRAQQGFMIGVQATPQVSWLMNPDDNANPRFDNSAAANCSFGISSQYGITPNHAIGLNLLYSYQGQRFALNGAERYKMVEYVKIPLLYIYTGGITKSLKFIGKIGPQLDLLTRARF